jgi:drug/metabolite transporter (DMT)-like permease
MATTTSLPCGGQTGCVSSAVGILTLLTYILVLQAYTIAHVSYVGALREVSIVLAALAGWRWLGEAFGALRTVGALLIFVGIVVIATAG